MKALIVEDDFVSSTLLEKILKQYGEVDIAVDGIEGLHRFKSALESGSGYDLICLDIMMPRMEGQEILVEIRQIEKNYGILGNEVIKVIMITALGDFENVKKAFREQCDAYLIKPIDKDKLLAKLKELNLA